MRTDRRSLGLYIHIPFCVRKCRYCDFLSAPASESERQAYVESLCRQIRLWGDTVRRAGERQGFAYEADTVFLGGGTPSLLTALQMRQILGTMRESFSLSEHAEITAECNPGTLDASRLTGYRRAGVNRLSLGLQSTDNAELRLLGRIHSWEQFLDNYRLARSLGFDNINIDLISALPGQSLQSLTASLEKAAALGPEHISVYSLIVEEGTPFYEDYRDQKELLPEETVEAMDKETWRILSDRGYNHYEISNYARPGRECRHNLKYWRCQEYLGLGTGASSYIRSDCGLTKDENAAKGSYVRLKNLSGIKSFEEEVLQDRPGVAQAEFLSRDEQMEEMAFLGLRMKEGVSLAAFQERFGRSFSEVYGRVVERYVGLGLMKQTGSHVRLTEDAVEVSNYIMADFLLEAEEEGEDTV